MFKLLIVTILSAHIHCYSSNNDAITAAILTKYTSEIIPVRTPAVKIPVRTIEVDAGELPININWKTRSSRITSTQTHISQPGSTQYGSSTDEPLKLQYEIIRPVQQDVREIVVPVRTVVQEVKPVQEKVERVVSTGRGVGYSGSGFNGYLAPKYLG